MVFVRPFSYRDSPFGLTSSIPQDITISILATTVLLGFNYLPRGSMNVCNIQSRPLPPANRLPSIPRRRSEQGRSHRCRQPDRLRRSHGITHRAIASNSSIPHRRIQHKHSVSNSGSILDSKFPCSSHSTEAVPREKKKIKAYLLYSYHVHCALLHVY